MDTGQAAGALASWKALSNNHKASILTALLILILALAVVFPLAGALLIVGLLFVVIIGALWVSILDVIEELYPDA